MLQADALFQKGLLPAIPKTKTGKNLYRRQSLIILIIGKTYPYYSLNYANMAYKIHRQAKGIYKKFSGFLTAEEFRESMMRFYADPDFENFLFSINDFTALTGFDISDKDIRTFAAHRLGAAFTAPVLVAVVATDPELIATISGYQKLTVSTAPTEIFPTLDEALAWLKEKTGLTITVPEDQRRS